jgi:hypothetical protein
MFEEVSAYDEDGTFLEVSAYDEDISFSALEEGNVTGMDYR